MRTGILFACLMGMAWGAPPWQTVGAGSVRGARANFAAPPPEYAMTLWWFWNTDMPEADIRRNLDDMRAHSVRSVLIWSYKGLSLEYLSPAWFERVRYAVDQAAARGMRVWIMDEGGYPSGFMGGRISRDFPGLRMQVLLPGDPPQPGFRTSPTRYVHTPGFAKDSTWSLFDALSPEATRVFLQGVHEKYREALGPRMGTTVLGIMGDEPSFPGVPWTPSLPEAFEKRKGYDVRPHLAALFAKEPSGEARRIQADYQDVWSGLYRDNFFKPQADWCARQGIDYLVHLCGEEDMKTLLHLNGDFFRCMRFVQMPGVDAIWRQIWPGTVADYPKLASSAAHLQGVPRSFTEAYAVYGRGLSLEQAKWVMDHHFVRGINQFQTMLYLSSREGFRPYFHPPDWAGSPQWAHFPLLAEYSNRASYLLSLGRPTASIAVYYPTTSGWLGDFEADRSALAIARALLESQQDFDFVDEDALRSGLTVDAGALRNRSGQRYRTVIVPSVSVISQEALTKLKALAAAGGRVVWMGRPPAMLENGSFRNAAPFRDGLVWAVTEPSDRMTPAVESALPQPDVRLEPAAPDVKYVHRALGDGDIYFFFNESASELNLTARVPDRGAPEFWDAATGRIAPAASTREAGELRVELTMPPFGSRFLAIAPGAPASAPPATLEPLAAMPLEGEWSVTIGGKPFETALKSWQELGQPGYSGPGTYRKTFRLPPEAKGKQILLDLGEVRYSAALKLNGRDLGARAWRPFEWNITAALRPGENKLEIEVRNTAANELAGNPARVAEIEGKGWLVNSYYRTYSKFDAEMVPSGLAGPVRLRWR
jgi:hypothetical protein